MESPWLFINNYEIGFVIFFSPLYHSSRSQNKDMMIDLIRVVYNDVELM